MPAKAGLPARSPEPNRTWGEAGREAFTKPFVKTDLEVHNETEQGDG